MEFKTIAKQLLKVNLHVSVKKHIQASCNFYWKNCREGKFLCDKKGCSPIHIACENANDRIVQQLLDNCAEVNVCDKEGLSPLYVMCENGHRNFVQLLLKNGAEINLCSERGSSDFPLAFEKGHDSIV